jgi:hypothetical protein
LSSKSTASRLRGSVRRLSLIQSGRNVSGGDISEAITTAGDKAQRLAEAHRELRADSNIQFDLPPPPPPPKLPDWLSDVFKWLGDVLKPIGRLMPDLPYARILLWGLLIAAALWLAWLLYVHFFPHHPLRRKRPEPSASAEDDGLPEAAVARRWLEEADALAASGSYAEAAHHLLIRSIEDIGNRRPHFLRPALTSRDIAAATEIPVIPRQLFANIAAVVERSLFGGRAVDAGDWSACRTAYDDFARGRDWRR